MKTNEELNALKEEVETLNKKLAELSEEELNQVAGGRPVDRIKFPLEILTTTMTFVGGQVATTDPNGIKIS